MCASLTASQEAASYAYQQDPRPWKVLANESEERGKGGQGQVPVTTVASHTDLSFWVLGTTLCTHPFRGIGRAAGMSSEIFY